MPRLSKLINKTLSVRLSLMVVSSMAILLMASLAVMLYFSRRAVKAEAFEKASQTLEGTVQRIDNVLLSVEQATGNIYFSLLPYLDRPDSLSSYCRQLVEANLHVAGCAIAFRPDYYKDRKYYMAYVHRHLDGSGIVEQTTREDIYLEQPWYSRPMTEGKPGWQKPIKGDKAEEVPIVIFSLPILNADNETIAVIGVGITLSQLSAIIAEARLSANSYSTLIDSDGSYIVHPDSTRLIEQNALSLTAEEADGSARKALEAMMSGETGYRPFRLNGTSYYVFYKPYKRTAVSGRTMEELSWSTGIVYPADDILGDYKSLLRYVLVIAVIGLLLLFLLCRIIIHRQLKPLLMLAEKAQHIAKGNYDEPIPDSRQKDEIGRLQDNFKLMQQSLAANVGELEQLTNTLQVRGEGLRAAYNEAKKADRLKIAFLHNMTNQMVAPADAIDKDVSALCTISRSKDRQATARLADDIQQKGNTIADVLKNLINISDDEMRKEGDHV